MPTMKRCFAAVYTCFFSKPSLQNRNLKKNGFEKKKLIVNNSFNFFFRVFLIFYFFILNSNYFNNKVSFKNKLTREYFNCLFKINQNCRFQFKNNVFSKVFIRATARTLWFALLDFKKLFLHSLNVHLRPNVIGR